MTVFHGSTCEVRVPDLSRSKRYIDFGPGFYVTTLRYQAERWAQRKAERTGGVPTVNEFGLKSDWSAYRVRNFPGASVEWLDFVCACRSGKAVWRQFDVIKGRVANDDVFKTIDSYLKGDITKTAAIRELRYAKPNDQIAINKVSALKTLLTFKGAYKVTMK